MANLLLHLFHAYLWTNIESVRTFEWCMPVGALPMFDDSLTITTASWRSPSRFGATAMRRYKATRFRSSCAFSIIPGSSFDPSYVCSSREIQRNKEGSRILTPIFETTTSNVSKSAKLGNFYPYAWLRINRSIYRNLPRDRSVLRWGIRIAIPWEWRFIDAFE